MKNIKCHYCNNILPIHTTVVGGALFECMNHDTYVYYEYYKNVLVEIAFEWFEDAAMCQIEILLRNNTCLFYKGCQNIFNKKINYIPKNITPDNAKEKLKTFMIFL